MKIPRWLMICLGLMIALTVSGAAALLGMSRPGPDVSGSWQGPDWGAVALQRTDVGVFERTYSSTVGTDVGRIQVAWSPRSRRYEGTCSEGTYRFGGFSRSAKLRNVSMPSRRDFSTQVAG